MRKTLTEVDCCEMSGPWMITRVFIQDAQCGRPEPEQGEQQPCEEGENSLTWVTGDHGTIRIGLPWGRGA
jgi:hypothetical protein